MSWQIGLIGVPSSAAAHWPGQEKAPQALRAAGLVDQLRAAGFSVVDHGDLPRSRSRLNKIEKHPQNLASVIQVARLVADQVELIRRGGEFPLVIGGDCTIELGVLSGFLRAGEDPALLYFDGGVDLYTPVTNQTGILDSMGVAHMIGEPGAAEQLCRIGPRFPLMADDAILYFGYGPNPGDTQGLERRVLEQHHMLRYPLEAIQGRVKEAANEARVRLEQKARPFIIHFDVDVIDFVDFPIADVPQFNSGLTFEEAMACLSIFASSIHCAGLVITEFNPDHTDEHGVVTATFVQGVVQALVQEKPI